MAPFDAWIQSLETRHLSDLRFQEVSRALRALSSTYIERRGSIHHGAALAGAGKRAAFALFYGPLHYLIVAEIVTQLDGRGRQPRALVDLGCGTGAAGAAWVACASLRPVTAIDRNPWPLAEAKRTYRQFDVPVRTRQGDMTTAPWPARAAILAAFSVNELAADGRERLLRRFLERAARGDTILVVEPIARSVAPWWPEWQAAFAAAGGRADEWRFRPILPEIVAKLDRAAGLDHRELSARSLWIAGMEDPPSGGPAKSP
jgi:Methyltransferase domain